MKFSTFKPFVFGALLLIAAPALRSGSLQENEKALLGRGIDLLPTPKIIAFEKPVTVKKALIVGNEKLPFFKTICDEINARFEELKPGFRAQIAPKPEAGAYNIIVSGDFKKPAGLPKMAAGCGRELYTLTPCKEGIVLAGAENALYAAVTLRSLLVKKGGDIVAHQAKVVDWPDFPVRRASIIWPFLNAHLKEPMLPRIKPFLDMLFRAKINSLGFLPGRPSKGDFNRVKGQGTWLSPRTLAVAKAISEYSAARNMKSGVLSSTFFLGDNKDVDDPMFKGMLVWGSGGRVRFHSWARTDLFARLAARCAEVLDQTGWKILIVHGVDTGGAADPERWSMRDEATKKRFGDDRAAADAAVIAEYVKAVRGTDVTVEAVGYPYHGRYLTARGTMRALNIPDTPEGRKAAEQMAAKTSAYLKRLHAQLPPEAAIQLREGSAAEVAEFRKHIPGRRLVLYFEIHNLENSVRPLICPEYLSIKSAYDPKESGECVMNRIDGDNMPGLTVPFAQYSWNAGFTHACDLDRTRNPLNYSPEAVAFLARFTATHFFGPEAGKELWPLFDNMLSLVYATDPFAAFKKCTRPFDLTHYPKKWEWYLAW